MKLLSAFLFLGLVSSQVFADGADCSVTDDHKTFRYAKSVGWGGQGAGEVSLHYDEANRDDVQYTFYLKYFASGDLHRVSLEVFDGSVEKNTGTKGLSDTYLKSLSDGMEFSAGFFNRDKGTFFKVVCKISK